MSGEESASFGRAGASYRTSRGVPCSPPPGVKIFVLAAKIPRPTLRTKKFPHGAFEAKEQTRAAEAQNENRVRCSPRLRPDCGIPPNPRPAEYPGAGECTGCSSVSPSFGWHIVFSLFFPGLHGRGMRWMACLNSLKCYAVQRRSRALGFRHCGHGDMERRRTAWPVNVNPPRWWRPTAESI